jgi:hypothetical protein
LTGIIDEEFFSGAVFLVEADIEFLDPLAIAFTELAVLVPIGVGLFIFVPQELKGNPFSFALPVKIFHGGHLALFWGNQWDGREKAVLQSGIVHLRRKWPG